MANDPKQQTVDMEKLECGCPCPPPPPECGCEQIPVIIERIKKPFMNPDGSFSRRYYYQYPITTFRAVHMGDSIHSPTLDDVLAKFSVKVNKKQPIIENGNKDAILTRGVQDGVVGELTKTDYFNPDRQSKTHVPSEFALYGALNVQASSYKTLVDREATRATGKESELETSIHEEVVRAKNMENDLDGKIIALGNESVKKDFLGETGTLIKDITLDADDISRVDLSVSRVSLMTGDTDTNHQQIDLLTPMEEKMDEKITEFGKTLNFVDPKIFDNVEDSVVVKTEFKVGEGDTIGRLMVTRKNVNGVGDDVSKFVSFKSETLEKKVNDVSDNEIEIVLTPKVVDTNELMDQIRALYA